MDISSCKLHIALMPFKSHLLRSEDGRHIKVCGITCSLCASDFIINLRTLFQSIFGRFRIKG